LLNDFTEPQVKAINTAEPGFEAPEVIHIDCVPQVPKAKSFKVVQAPVLQVLALATAKGAMFVWDFAIAKHKKNNNKSRFFFILWFLVY